MRKELSCPLCGGRVIETAKGFACENWPGVKGACRFTVWKESYGAEFNEEDVERLIEGRKVRKVNQSRDGSRYEADWTLSDDGKKAVFVRVEADDGQEENVSGKGEPEEKTEGMEAETGQGTVPEKEAV